MGESFVESLAVMLTTVVNVLIADGSVGGSTSVSP
jgi:hypothetical protein